MKYLNTFPKQSILFVLLIILLFIVLISPIPAGTRTTTNACSGCHSDRYEMFLSILSHNVSSLINEDWRIIQCNISVTGNMAEQAEIDWPFYNSTVTVTATSTNNLISIQGSPSNYFPVRPIFNTTVNFTAKGKGNGSDIIKFEATIVPAHKPVTCMRTEIVYVSTKVKINVPPLLSNGKVTPTHGSVRMRYIYEVNYKDADGDIPEFVAVTINGKHYKMATLDGNLDTIATIGEVFFVEVDGLILGIGTEHMYNFSAFDGKHLAIGESIIRYEPKIDTVDYPPSCKITYPLGGLVGGELNITGIANDPEPDDNIEFVEISVSKSEWLITNGTNSWYILIDLFQWTDGPHIVEARAFNGSVYSTIDKVNVKIDNSLKNTPPTLYFDLLNNSIVGPLVYINGTIVDPNLPDQEIEVFVGINTEPTLRTNFSVEGSRGIWSIRLNLSTHQEGNFEIYAMATDPYSNSEIKKLPLILEIPNIPPIITFDEIPATLWENHEFTGKVEDVDSDELKVFFSFDNRTWSPTNVSNGKWKIWVNLMSLLEKKYSIYIKVNDSENEVIIKKVIIIKGPMEPPIIYEFSPTSPIEIFIEENITFRATFRAGDHRGVNITWLLDSDEVIGFIDNNQAIIDLIFNKVGEFHLDLIISNAEIPSLKVTNTWQIVVKSIIKIESLCGIEFDTFVGEVIVLRFGEVKGECEEIVWRLGGGQVIGGKYYLFKPESPGVHRVTVTATDKYGNSDAIIFTIKAEEQMIPELESLKKQTLKESESKTMENIIIGSVGLLLIIIVIVAILMVILAVRKHRKIKITKTVEQDRLYSRVSQPKAPISSYQTKPIQTSQSQIYKKSTITQTNQPYLFQRIIQDSAQARIPTQPHIQSQNLITPQSAQLSGLGPPTLPNRLPNQTSSQTYQQQQFQVSHAPYPIISVPQFQQNIPQHQYYRINNYGQQPTSRVSYQNLNQNYPPYGQSQNYNQVRCPFCNGSIQYIKGQNAYWCTICQQFR